jgi:hypothetical protein
MNNLPKLSRRMEADLDYTRAELRSLTVEAWYSKTSEGGCTIRMIASLEGPYKPAYPNDRPVPQGMAR